MRRQILLAVAGMFAPWLCRATVLIPKDRQFDLRSDSL